MSQKRLVEYMKKRTKRIQDSVHPSYKEDVNVPKMFFNAKDEHDLFALSDNESNKIWDSIKENVRAQQGAIGFSSEDSMVAVYKKIHPFCFIAKENCSRCNYGKRHGKCFAVVREKKYYRTSNQAFICGCAKYADPITQPGDLVSKVAHIYFNFTYLKGIIKKINPLK